MIFLIAFGLIGLLFPGWLMACIGLDSRLEEEGCLLWFFRIVGAVLLGAGVWSLIGRSIYYHH